MKLGRISIRYQKRPRTRERTRIAVPLSLLNELVPGVHNNKVAAKAHKRTATPTKAKTKQAVQPRSKCKGGVDEESDDEGSGLATIQTSQEQTKGNWVSFLEVC